MKHSHDEVARKAYAIYEKEGRPLGHDVQNWLDAEKKMPHGTPALGAALMSVSTVIVAINARRLRIRR
jgi:hypothetical protein